MRLLVLLTCHLLLGTLSLAAEDRPNIVVFLTDDLGWGDLACYGHPVIKTPHLDQFSTEGARFTQCYSACGVCSPSRASVLTGRTPYRNGVWRWIPGGHSTHLRESEITLPELLKTVGYQTCHVGKWHLNGHFNSDRHPQPDAHGYDHWFATQNNASPNHKNPTNFVRNGEPVGKLEGFSAPLVAEEAVRWMKSRDPKKPFLLSVWTHEPHLPIESAPEFMAPYAEIDNPDIRQHHGNITQLDHAFGIVSKALDELGLRDNTLVIFTSDNGPEGRGNNGRTRGSTGGLRGRKRDSHEGGIRVPGIVRWPGQINAGTVVDTPVIGSDIFTTVLGIVGIPLPDDRTIDGTDIRPAFDGQPVERAVPLFWRTHIAPEDSRAALRIGDWKLVTDETHTKFQLYDIVRDHQETNDLAATEPEKLEELKTAFFKVWKGIEAEGPRGWWENEPTPKRTPKKRTKSAALPAGSDTTGDWPIIKGGTVSKAADGNYLLDSTDSQALALQPINPPVTTTATFKVTYQTATKDITRNAFLAFGDATTNDATFKAGTMIGMGAHGIFQGGWNNVSTGTSAKPKTFDPGKPFTAHLVVNFEKHTAVLQLDDGTRLEHKLPDTIDKLTHIGLYTKSTKSTFSPITITR